MNPRRFLLSFLAFACLSASALAQSSTDPNEGSQLNQDPSSGAYTFSWWGRAGRTYFLQQSDDLINWTYLPVIESGTEQVIQWGFTSTAPACFLRLEPTDIPTDDPFDDDFNNDGLTNWQNLLQGSDPLAVSVMDTNGFSLNWEQFYNVPAGTDPNAAAPRGDGLTYSQTFEQGLNPNDYYNGQTPILTVVSGTPQTGAPNGFVPLPLVVSVTDADDNPFGGAPVTFMVSQGGGQMQTSSSTVAATLITVLTDSSGQAQVFFQLPNALNSTSQVTAMTGSGSQAVSVIFEASSDDGSSTYGSPFDPSNVVASGNVDGSGVVTWTNNADPTDQTPIDVQYMDANGNWVTMATVSAGTTSYQIPAQ